MVIFTSGTCRFGWEHSGSHQSKKYACPPTRLVPPAYMILHVKNSCPLPRRKSHLNVVGPPDRASPTFPYSLTLRLPSKATPIRTAFPTPHIISHPQHIMSPTTAAPTAVKPGVLPVCVALICSKSTNRKS